jgi:hypothetical protein
MGHVSAMRETPKIAYPVARYRLGVDEITNPDILEAISLYNIDEPLKSGLSCGCNLGRQPCRGTHGRIGAIAVGIDLGVMALVRSGEPLLGPVSGLSYSSSEGH